MYWPLPQSSALMTRTLHEGNVAPASAGTVWPSHVVAVTSCPCDESPRTLPSAGGSAPVATSPRGEYRISIVAMPCATRTCCRTSVGCLFFTVSCCPRLFSFRRRDYTLPQTLVSNTPSMFRQMPQYNHFSSSVLFVRRKMVAIRIVRCDDAGHDAGTSLH